MIMRIHLIAIPFLLLISCDQPNKTPVADAAKDNDTLSSPDMHTSEISLDWEGRYTGLLPCADCEGIETTVNLLGDQTFIMREIYIGKGEDPIEETGDFVWTEDGGSVELETV